MKKLLLVLGLALVLSGCGMDESQIGMCKQYGYDYQDVEVFCEQIGLEYHNFFRSPSIRRQYEQFRDGKDTDFLKEARANKKASDARSSGQASGMATGMCVGMAMSSSN